MRFLFLSFFCVAMLSAQDRVLTPEDIAGLKSVGSAELSPDGNMIAYTLSVPRAPFEEESGSSYLELHVWDADRGSRPFITGKVRVGGIKWAPDSKGICFLAKRGDDEHTSLYMIPVDGGEARRILSHDTGINNYQWSDDGKQIVFLASEEKNETREALKEDGFNMHFYEEDLRRTQVWVADMSGDEPKTKVIEGDGHFSSAKLSPDGKHVAIMKAPTPLVDDGIVKVRVHILEASSGKEVMAANNPGKLGDMAWSPNGKKLAFISAADMNDPSAGRLYVADVASKKIDRHFMDAKGDVSQFAWQDNNSILYLWDEGVDTTIAVLNLNGGKTEAALDQKDTSFPGLSYSGSSKKMALVGDSPYHPRELFMWDGKNVERLTWSNPVLEKVKMAKQEVVTYKARDGLELQGLLVRPLNEEKGKRYPLIVVVHGGPEAHYRNGWLTGYSTPGQVGAAKGYAVFYPNYRASTGRGVEFSKLDHGRPAMEQFDDLVDGVKHLVDMGLVDEKKVGVTGGSYGGYATAWCSTALTEHFAAGVMFVGISNKISKSGTSDIPEELYLVHDRKRLWDDWQLFLKQSPIYHVQKARTPLLIMHGEEDTRVHPSQSMELYRHLKTLNQTPVRLIFYPGEGHGNRKSASRYDYNHRMLRWFDHYLKGEGGDPPPLDIDYPLNEEAE